MKAGARAPRDSGYILLGITIMLVILGISLVAAVPLWQKAVQREREQELIFRGYQYMQAIDRYQRKYPGAYPPSVDILVEQKFLRKAYKDPMGGKDGEWNVLRQMSPELQLGQQQQMQQAAEAAGINDLNRSRARLRTPGGETAGAPGSQQPGGSSRSFQSSLGRGASGDASMGGIVGVASRSTEKTFYRVPGKEKYKDWFFVWGVQPGGVPAVMPGQAQQSPFPGLPPPPRITSFGFGGGPAAPGQPGQPGLPPGAQPPGGFPGQPGQGLPGQSGQSGFGNPGQSGFGQPGLGNTPGGMQPQPQQRRKPD
ncbi:MAG TPA: type II secretion system protein [Vicinamibacteria bacterium]